MAYTKDIPLSGYLSDDLASIKLEHHRVMRRALQPWAGKRLMLMVGVFRRRRTEAQNRYMWGYVVPRVKGWMEDKDGRPYSKDAVYVFLRKLIGHEIQVEVIEGQEIIFMREKRFSQMTTVEFNKAIQRIQKHFAKKGLDIADPSEDNMLPDFLQVRIERTKKRHGEEDDE